jgi:hypothetical protein
MADAIQILEKARGLLAEAAQGRDLDDVTRALLRATAELARAQRALKAERPVKKACP